MLLLPGGAEAHLSLQGQSGPRAPPSQAPLSEGYRRDRVFAYLLRRAMVKPLTEDGRSCQILIAMFSRVDQDEDGKIDFKQLQQALVNMGWATIKEDRMTAGR